MKKKPKDYDHQPADFFSPLQFDRGPRFNFFFKLFLKLFSGKATWGCYENGLCQDRSTAKKIKEKNIIFNALVDMSLQPAGQWKSQAVVMFSEPRSINLNELETCIFRYWERLSSGGVHTYLTLGLAVSKAWKRGEGEPIASKIYINAFKMQPQYLFHYISNRYAFCSKVIQYVSSYWSSHVSNLYVYESVGIYYQTKGFNDVNAVTVMSIIWGNATGSTMTA